jgi:putative SOS response-associated peptidase YedK
MDPGGRTSEAAPAYLAAGAEPFAFAALWEEWHPPEGKATRSTTTVTTTPNESIAPVHNRMPVILTTERGACWLDHTADPLELLALLVPYEGERVMAPASPLVNSPAIEGPLLALPPSVSANSGAANENSEHS